MLQVSSTSAGPPILYGRIRPMAGALPQGTEQCIDARPLRLQRHGSFWCSERGRGAGRRPSQRPLREAQAPQASGVHGRRRPVEYPTVANAVIEALDTMTYWVTDGVNASRAEVPQEGLA
jgi:hypothetical protein